MNALIGRPYTYGDTERGSTNDCGSVHRWMTETCNAHPYEQTICWHVPPWHEPCAIVDVFCAPPFRNSKRQKWNGLLDVRSTLSNSLRGRAAVEVDDLPMMPQSGDYAPADLKSLLDPFSNCIRPATPLKLLLQSHCLEATPLTSFAMYNRRQFFMKAEH